MCLIVTGDFNARCSRWWQNDIANSTGQEIDSLVANNSTSCIDLLFCTNLNTTSNYGIDVSIFDKCHQNIIFGKVNIRVPLPPVHIHEVWNYSQVNVENIKYPISNFNWSKAFEDFSADGKVKHLKKTLLNIFEFIFQLKKLSAIIVNLFGLMIT